MLCRSPTPPEINPSYGLDEYSQLLQDILREAGCLQRLSALLKSYKLAITIGHQVDPDCLQCALNAVNNLAMNANNQPLLAVSSSAFYFYFTDFIQITL